MQETCILHQKHSHAHCDVITDEYITDKVQNQAGRRAIQFQLKFTTFGKEQLFNEHWYLSVKNTEVHDGTLNVITAIKLSNTDNVVVVVTDVNLLILLSKRSHHSNA